MSTEACTQVVAGSWTVTPARIQPCRMRRFISAFMADSWTRSLMPSVCHASSIRWPATAPPIDRAYVSTSVR